MSKEHNNAKFRSWLGENYPGAILLEPGVFDQGIIGVKGGRVVYGYDELCEALATDYLAWNKSKDGPGVEDYGFDEAYAEAVDWIDFNTIRSLPYYGVSAPILAMYDPERECLVDQADLGEEPEELVFDRNCPGLTKAA